MKSKLIFLLFMALAILAHAQAPDHPSDKAYSVPRSGKAAPASTLPYSQFRKAHPVPPKAGRPTGLDEIKRAKPIQLPSAGQANSEAAFRKSDPDVQIRYAADGQTPVFLAGRLSRSDLEDLSDSEAVDTALVFLETHREFFGLKDPRNELALRKAERDALGQWHLRFDQQWQGIPVWGADLVMHLDTKGVRGFGGRCQPTPGYAMKSAPGITSVAAVQVVEQDLAAFTKAADLSKMPPAVVPKNARKATLMFVPQPDGAFQLVWAVDYFANLHDNWRYFVDAQTGAVLKKSSKICHNGPATATAKDLNNVSQIINTYELGGKYYLLDGSRPMFDLAGSNLPGEPKGGILTLDAQNDFDPANLVQVISPNNTWNNPGAVSAHHNAAICYEYYLSKHNRNSIDGQGGSIVSVVNAGDFDNALWAGGLMIYGNGQTAFLSPLQKNLDIAAHEMTHGVMENTANLIYESQSGALNESFSDVFACLIDDTNWQLAEGNVNTSLFPSGALRDMADPHNGGQPGDEFWQPERMSEYLNTMGDNGGVHINSGIPNHAFYLFAQVVGRDKAGQVYYRALTQYLTYQSQFIDCRRAIIQSAQDLYPGTDVADQAASAFDAVEIFEIKGTVYEDFPPIRGTSHIITDHYDPQIGDYVIKRYDLGNQLNEVAESANASPKVSVALEASTQASAVGAFVGYVDKKAYFFDPLKGPGNTAQIPIGGNWGKIALNPWGDKAALVRPAGNQIFLYDLSGATPVLEKTFSIVLPNGIAPSRIGSIEFSPTGQVIIFDAFRNGQWGCYRVFVWSNALGVPGTGEVYDIFLGQPSDESYFEPTYAKTDPLVFAFSRQNPDPSFFLDQNTTSVWAVSMQTGQSSQINGYSGANLPTGLGGCGHHVYGRASFSPDDRAIVFQTYGTYCGSINLNGDQCNSKLTLMALQPDKIHLLPGGCTMPYDRTASDLVRGEFPVWFAAGTRDWQKPGAKFQALTSTKIQPGSTVEFENLSTDCPTSWLWHFPGGEPLTFPGRYPPAVVYKADGVYPVTLIVKNPAGADSTAKVAYVTVGNPPPPCALALDTAAIAKILPVCGQTSGSVTLPPATGGTPPYEYRLDGGAYQTSLTFSNLAAGQHIAQVRQTADTCTVTAKFHLACTSCPDVVAGISQSPGPGPGEVKFTGVAQGGNIVSWAWNFGDSQTGTGQTVTHTYAASGLYNVTLTAKNDCGKTATATVTIAVFSATLLVGEAKGQPSDSLLIPLVNFDYEGTITGIIGTVVADTAVVRFIGFKSKTLLGAESAIINPKNSQFLYTGPPSGILAAPGDTLMYLVFEVKTTASPCDSTAVTIDGSSKGLLECAIATVLNGTPYEFVPSIVVGKASVPCQMKVSGTVRTAQGLPVPNALVSGIGTSPKADTLTNALGEWQLAMTWAPVCSIGCQKPGPFHDGIGISDATAIKRVMVGLSVSGFTPYTPVAADLNCDGKVDLTDAKLLNQFIVGIVDSLPCQQFKGIPADHLFQKWDVFKQSGYFDIPPYCTVASSTAVPGGHIRDFVAVVRGDLNGDGDASGLAGGNDDRRGQSVEWTYRSAPMPDGSVRVVLSAAEAAHFAGFTLALHFDSENWRYAKTSASGIALTVNEKAAASGRLRLIAVSADGQDLAVAAGESTVELLFLPKNGSTAAMPGLWTGESLASETANESGERYAIALRNDDATPTHEWAQSAAAQLAPNPCHDAIGLRLAAGQTGQAFVTVTDATGRTLFSESLQLGASDDRLSISTADWPTGSYLCRVILRDGIWQKHFVVAH